MLKRLLSVALCLCILFGILPVAQAYTNTADWAKDAVASMYELGFLPPSLQNANMTRIITRKEMCKMAVLVFEHLTGGYPYPDSTDHFEDTEDPDICYAYEQGIISGYGNGKFGPNDPLTREQFFKITYNLMGTAYCNPQVELQSLDAFRDGSTVSSYAVKPTQIMVAIGIVKGSNGKLNPKNNTTCQEAITMFFRAYEYMCQWFAAQTEESKQIQIESQGYSGISNWAISSVMTMKEKNMIPSSLDNCNMTTAITREQMCSVAMLAYTAATKETYYPVRTDHFKDTQSTDVCAAYELGIISGYGNGKFGPNNTLTREQFFKIMANFMKVIGYPREDSRAVSLLKYNDGNKVADWAQSPARLLIYIGAVMGDGKNLSPKNNTSIQEALTVFLRCYNFTIAWQKEHPDGEDYVEPTVIDDLLAFAKSYEGYPYVYGGNGPNNFDCSGFVLYCYKHFGYSFSRGAQEQYNDGVKVGHSELLPGDLVFFSSNGYYITHVGLYLGEGQFIHASNPTRGVVIDTLWSGYYYSHFWGGCRIITD
ncbi:MAG: S-layer homology domain-containing protein [Oscillospiraceae bacterium]|nr:S-layer homology domain-containing protein [Oscillospiraceae bacterium]